MPASFADNPYVDAQGRTDAELYLMGCLDGSIVAGRRIKALAEKMLPRIREGYKVWRYDVDAATRPVEFIERFLKIPSGKLGVPFILEPYERMIIELAFGFIDENEKRQYQYVLVEMARKNGKALSLDTEIPTPDGWKLMRDIHTGDLVFGQDGKPSKVVMESEIFDKPMYLVTFEDGATIKASADHIWTVCDKYGATKANLATKEMYEMLFYGGKRYVPTCRNPIVYHTDVIDKGASVGDFYNKGFAYSFDFYSFDKAECDVIRFAPVTSRRAYVHGVIDGSRHNALMAPTFGSRNNAEFVAEIASSIGLVAAIAEAPRVGSWSVTIEEKPAKSIVSIERIPNERSKCIAIDNDSHLYLAGRQYTATHNSSLGAAIELYMLVADGEGAPQIYNAATSKAQASLAYGAVWRMARQSPKLLKILRKGTVTERAENGVICDGNMGYVLPLSKQSDHLDGLDVHMCLFDEMAAAEDRSVFDLIRQGTGAREQPLMVAITTQGFVRDNLWDHERDYAVQWLDGKIEDDRFLGILFEQDDRSEIWDESTYGKSNPGINVVKKMEYMRAQVLKAKNDPSYMPTLLTKDFNLPANQASAYLTFEESVNDELFTFDPNVFRYCVVGIDAADTIDLNAATALFMRPGDNHIYRRSMYWIAEEQVKVNSNNQRGRDGVPYHEWAARGLIRIVPGNKVDKRVFIEWIQELADEGMYTRYVGYDPWHMDDSTLRDMKSLVGEGNVEVIRQGVQTLSQPMKQLKADLRDRRIINNHNPIDEWCNLNLAAKIDINENVQPVKKAGATTRIDGYMALLDAYIELLRHEGDYLMTIGWDG